MTRRLWPEVSALELPHLAAQDRDAVAIASDPVHLELRRPDHEVGVDLAVIEPACQTLLGRKSGRILESRRDSCPVGDVTGRVLVQQRVEEDDARLSDR